MTVTDEPLHVHRCGEQALLVDFADIAAVARYRAVLRRHPINGVAEVVSGARTLLVRFERSTVNEPALRKLLQRRGAEAASELSKMGTGAAVVDTPVLDIPVVYDGEDLADVARVTGLGVAGVIAAHTSVIWTSAFCGFAPGFSYLVSQGHPLSVPRRTTSRTVVPAGAVGLAGEFSAVYPRNSPGGWQLIGHTDVQMWSLERTVPAFAPPGTRIRFVNANANTGDNPAADPAPGGEA